jgi:hypothetical protein
MMAIGVVEHESRLVEPGEPGESVRFGVQVFRVGIALALAAVLVLIAWYTYTGIRRATDDPALSAVVGLVVLYAEGMFLMVLAVGLAIAAYIASRVDV